MQLPDHVVRTAEDAVRNISAYRREAEHIERELRRMAERERERLDDEAQAGMAVRWDTPRVQHGASDRTANSALRVFSEMSRGAQQLTTRLAWVRAAIDAVDAVCQDPEARQFIEVYYWRDSGPYGTATALSMSLATVYRRRRLIVARVALLMGLMPPMGVDPGLDP